MTRILASNLRCVTCGREYSFDDKKFLCPKCGKKLYGKVITTPGTLEVGYHYDGAESIVNKNVLKCRSGGVWKYSELLPIFNEEFIVTLGEGDTPLTKCERLGHELSLNSLYIKNETLNPTGSFKDRGAAVAISKAREYGFDTVSCASSGSLAAAIAAYASKAGLKSYIFVPAATPHAKITQALMYGAKVIAVRGIYEEAMNLQIEVCEDRSWYNCTNGLNPFRLEGDKTTAYEICEQLGWNAPDKLIIPTGSGGNLAGEWKGFKEFFKLGLIHTLPKLIAVQVTAGAPIAKAFLEDKDEASPLPLKSVEDTIAGGLVGAYSEYGTLALRAIRESHGIANIVDDKSILEAQKLLAQTEGIFAEPSGAASIASLIQMAENKEVNKNEVIVCVITGNGLRDIEVARGLVPVPIEVEPNIEDFRRAMQGTNGAL